ncbi:YjcZ family sporulation protein [Parageobacillus thermoglucosidasius]|nr:YjcZ family sporulation protein [Parageobacillus thermoglucosidasius]MED4903042.1 YjcZ family sporulation protein [Parageobacillus thermoglucosidasius]MED4915165.1 YjcZ family sporulation protein [Parageobacillus thermoglucosidasius]MED4945946.1 YjcZ family sporulation protein [Parageobacillus thermoglucosidasius]MED4981686.1 YjcZ family sporulation protein [Parageobacillus thermoglucosidasius]
MKRMWLNGSFLNSKGGVTMSGAPYAGGFALIVVLFILLIIVGCACLF